MHRGVIEIKSDGSPQAGSGAAHCGGCLHTALGPVCRALEGADCSAPQLLGPPAALQRVMDALAARLARPGQPVGELVHALRLTDGEAELTLNVAPLCSGAELADRAFQTLRALLPDTDIYVRHRA